MTLLPLSEVLVLHSGPDPVGCRQNTNGTVGRDGTWFGNLTHHALHKFSRQTTSNTKKAKDAATHGK
eukprot:12812871-Prorocentrum_lima.AAC.1